MSELKAYRPYANRDGFYHKSEADKVIAHHKYKRCLAMAKRCLSKCSFLCFKCDFYCRWHNRWLELAEKFKDNEH